MATLTCIATMIIKLPTPNNGYVNLGDGMVLACGILLGPIPGALAGGIGSALADLINNYTEIAPITFIIKAFCATIAAITYKILTRHSYSKHYDYINIAISGALGELFMILGYYVYDVALILYKSNRLNKNILLSTLLSSTKELPYNLLQAAIGIIVSLLVIPMLSRLMSKEK